MLGNNEEFINDTRNTRYKKYQFNEEDPQTQTSGYTNDWSALEVITQSMLTSGPSAKKLS